MAATRCAERAQVCVPHIDNNDGRLRHLPVQYLFGDQDLAAAGRLLAALARPQAEGSWDFGAIWQRFPLRLRSLGPGHHERARQHG
jgi:hypothetical protein